MSVAEPVEPAPVSEPPASLLRQIAPPRRKPLHPAAYALIAMSAVFGGVSAVLLVSRPPPAAPQTIVVQVPSLPPTAGGEAAGRPAEAPAADPAAPEDTKAASSALEAKAPGSGAPQAGRPADAKGAAPAATANIDMSGFSNQAVAGPSAGPESGGSAGAGGQLSAGEINGIVAQNQPLIRRKCWQPALDARAGMGPSARVTATLVIGSSGGVDSVSAGGAENDYPGLSSCIAGRVKGWKFPPSGGSTTVRVPFVFAAQ